jgi:hypothetical protein
MLHRRIVWTSVMPPLVVCERPMPPGCLASLLFRTASILDTAILGSGFTDPAADPAAARRSNRNLSAITKLGEQSEPSSVLSIVIIRALIAFSNSRAGDLCAFIRSGIAWRFPDSAGRQRRSWVRVHPICSGLRPRGRSPLPQHFPQGGCGMRSRVSG